jgi:RNA polymerase sigma-70 factor (ECF subfamily)
VNAGRDDADGAADDGSVDRDLLRRHLQGDPDAFAGILHRHRDHLWAVAMRTMGNPDDAADALQDALLSAMRHADSFRGDAKLSTWLHRIVVNACLDRLRRANAHPTVAMPDDDALERAAAERRSGDPADPFDARDVAADVHAALATLPAEQRAAIVLVDIEGYGVDEVAAILEVPSGTVKSRCSRGRAKLLPLLRHLGPPSAPVRGDGNPDAPSPVEPPMTPSREELR